MPKFIEQINIVSRQIGYDASPSNPNIKFLIKLLGAHNPTKQIALRIKAIIIIYLDTRIIGSRLVFIFSVLTFFSFFCLEVFKVDLYIDYIIFL